MDRTARKNDARLLNVQKLITTATATLVNASDQLHHVTTALADQSTRGGEQPNPSRFVEAANEMLASNGDVIDLLGTAQQELSIRRRYQLQHALPKDTASLCSNENIPITDKPFGDDADKSIKTAIKRDFQNRELQFGGQRPTPTNADGKKGLFFFFFFFRTEPPPTPTHPPRPLLHSTVSGGATAASGGEENIGTREG